MRITVTAVAICMSIVGLSTADDVQASIRQPTNIPAQSLAAALQSLARDRGFQLVYVSEEIGDRRTAGAVGEFTPEEALEQLLSGTGLTYKYLDDKTVTILPVNAKTAHPARTESTSSEAPGTDNGKGVKQDTSNSFRLAQEARGASTGPSSVENEDSESASEKNPVQLEEVTVTGSLIPGATPASPVIVIDREAIDRSGYATIGEVIRSLPVNFGGGQNPGTTAAPLANTANNLAQASTANLRGLGSDATLTLVNGHRLAFNGLSDSVDISSIPLAAVERIEILTDGASAIYGSDAVAGVVNVILKPDYSGAETALRYGDTTHGGGGSRQFDQTAGMSGERGGFILTYEHFDQNQLLASDRVFSSLAYSPMSLLPSDTRDTGFFSGHFNVNSAVSIFTDALFTHRDPATYSAYGPTYLLDKTPINQLGLASGLRIALPANWNASVTGTFARDAELDTEVEDGTQPFFYSFSNKTLSGEVQASGPLVSLWSGPVAVALAAGYRREQTVLDFDGSAAASRDIKYGAMELNVPLVAPDASWPALQRLELSTAIRHENYSDFGNATNPKFGLVYVPVPDLTFKGTWGRSFHAPGLYDKYGPQITLISDAADLGEDEPGKVGLTGLGSNPQLGAETAHGWTVSIDYRPSWLNGAKAVLSAYGIDYRNRITSPLATGIGILGNPIDAPFIVTNPSAGLISAVTQAPYVVYNASSAQSFSPANVFAYYEGYLQNVTRQNVSGLDLLLSERFQTTIGVFEPSLDVSRIDLDQYNTPGSLPTPLSGTIFNVPRYKARGSMSWTQRGWSVSAFVNFTSSELDNTGTYLYGPAPIAGHVASWTTVDAQLAYAVTARNAFLNDLKIAFSVQNLLDRVPPSIPYTSIPGEYAGLGFDPDNASALGRALALSVSKKF